MHKFLKKIAYLFEQLIYSDEYNTPFTGLEKNNCIQI